MTGWRSVIIISDNGGLEAGKKLEEIDRLLAEALEDATIASDEAMRLMAGFGQDPLLLNFVSTSNQYKMDIATLKAKLLQLRQEMPSSARNLKVQILLAQATATRTRAGRFKETVMEVGRND
ncbi:MAG TPA: hypothetical protein DCP31_37995 [Cyanobacteria bacterium UBA8543]|nr:hypothetical protein [Cyanobacteria bacterium UBA8543]